MSYWSKGLDISNLTILLDIATSSGMDPEEFEDFIKSSEAKNTLIYLGINTSFNLSVSSFSIFNFVFNPISLISYQSFDKVYYS